MVETQISFWATAECILTRKNKENGNKTRIVCSCCPKQLFRHSIFSPTSWNDVKKEYAGSINKKTVKCSDRPPTAFQLVGKKAVHGFLSDSCLGVKGETRRFQSAKCRPWPVAKRAPGGVPRRTHFLKFSDLMQWQFGDFEKIFWKKEKKRTKAK